MTTMDETWLLMQLQERNCRETVPFRSLQQAHDRLLLQVDTLLARLEASEREKATLRQQLDDLSSASSTTPSSSTKKSTGGAFAAALKSEARLRDKLEKLQEEFDLQVKENATEKEAAQQISQEISSLREEQAQNLAKIAELEKEGTKASQTIEHWTNACHEAQSRAELAEQQYNGLKLTIRAMQTEQEALKKENKQLGDRVVSEKQKLVQEMNSLTELVESLKQERDKLRALQTPPSQEPPKTSLWFGTANSVMSSVKSSNRHSAATTSTTTTTTTSSSSYTANTPTTPIAEDPTRKVTDLKVTLPTKPKFVLAAHTTEGVCVRYDTSGHECVVTAGTDVKVWDAAAQGILKRTWKGSAGHAFLSCDMTGSLVAGGSTDKTCRVWTLPTNRMVHQLVGHQDKITAVRFCGSGEAIVTASADHTLKVWDISRTTYKQLNTLRHASTPSCVDVGTDSLAAVSGHHDGGLRCWDLRSGNCTSDWKGVCVCVIGIAS